MKKKIVIGSILSVLMLVLLPSVSSLKFNTVSEVRKSFFFEKIEDMNIKDLIEKIDNGSSLIFFGFLIRIVGFLLLTIVIAAIIYLYVSNIINPPD